MVRTTTFLPSRAPRSSSTSPSRSSRRRRRPGPRPARRARSSAGRASASAPREDGQRGHRDRHPVAGRRRHLALDGQGHGRLRIRRARAGACALRRYGIRVDRRAVVRVHLEVEVRVDPVRVARSRRRSPPAGRPGRCAPSLSPGAYAMPATHLPWLSFPAVRSLFRWMYW